MEALGMIEVMGLPPAIEGADSALKAANVVLLAIAKAGGGILTVEITGDVGAVTAAVDAGAAAAERVGTLRAKHVIPHVDESLVGKVLLKETKLFSPKKKSTLPMNQNANLRFSSTREDGAGIHNEKSGVLIENSGTKNGEFGNMGKESPSMINEKEAIEGNPKTKSKEPKTEEAEPKTEKAEIETEETELKTEEVEPKTEKAELKTEKAEPKAGETEPKTEETELKAEETELKAEITEEGSEETEPKSEKTEPISENTEIKSEETEPITNYTVTDLKKKSNDTLRAILQSQGVKLTELHKSAKKQELIQTIMAQQNRR